MTDSKSETKRAEDPDIRDFNRRAWNRQVEAGNTWTIPVSPEEVARARGGDLRILLTPRIHVPTDWYPDLKGCRVLALASGGGQQGPLLAAAGARVTVYDNSPNQLKRDREVADREGLPIDTVEGDMRDLGAFADGSFDFIVHPVSNVFVPDIRPVWQESFRVLSSGGAMIAGMTNPCLYLFDEAPDPDGRFIIRHALPYSDLERRSPEQLANMREKGEPLEFSHTLDTQIGGLLTAGFCMTAFYEDNWGPEEPLGKWFNCFYALRVEKI